MSRAALYCRLSKEDETAGPGGESESIQNQKALLAAYAQDKGWEIAGVYSDEDYSGADRDRPGFRRLLADAEARRFDILLVGTGSWWSGISTGIFCCGGSDSSRWWIGWTPECRGAKRPGR